MNLILIGCGAVVEQLHLPVLCGRKDVRLFAFVDKNIERAKFFARFYKVPFVCDTVTNIPLERVDAAVIATPPSSHASLSKELIAKKIHILVEKPLALNFHEAREIVDLAEEKGVKIAVPLYRRLFPSFRLLFSLIKKNVFGSPLSFSVQGGGLYNWPAASLGNMKKELAGGGVLMDLGPHFLDFLFQLFDEPVEILDYLHDSQGGIEADCFLKLRFFHQGQAVEGVVELARTRKLKGGLKIECEKAFLEFYPSERFKIKILPKGKKLADFFDYQEKPFVYHATWHEIPNEESWYATFARVYDDWLGAIKENGEPLLSARSTLPVIRLIEECYHNSKPFKQSWVEPPSSRINSKKIHLKKRPKALLTGATGFIGCRIAEILRLREGWDVRAVVRSPGKAARLARLDVEMVQFDLAQSRGFETLVKGCDAVIHCAVGTEYGNPKKIYQVTVEGTRRLARAALKERVKCFVHVSSMAVYGSKISGLIDESFPVKPDPGSVYGETKAKAERVVQYYVKKGLPAVIFRPARVFGPFGFTFVTNPLQAIAEGRFAWKGNPDTPCDMIYVDNVVEAFVCALYADPGDIGGEVFNLGEQDTMTWREFYRQIIEALGLSINLSEIPVVNTPLESRPNFPIKIIRNLKDLATSSEFKAFMRKVVYTDPIGAIPRKILEISTVENLVKKFLGSNELPVYRESEPAKPLVVFGGGTNAVLSIEKLKSKLGYHLVCSREESITRTVDWVKFAGII